MLRAASQARRVCAPRVTASAAAALADVSPQRVLRPIRVPMGQSVLSPLRVTTVGVRAHSRGLFSSAGHRHVFNGVEVVVRPDIAEALEVGEPVVALESTIISHGMPFPQNAHTAIQIQDIIQRAGARAATIGILNGAIHVGMTDEQIEYLGSEGAAGRVSKTSRRDIAAVVATGRTGATTVSGTMTLAHAAGIPVFVTGGIGGVHRGAEVTMDVSADLTELGRTPVTVVCAGVKSILDIPRTLEYLETQGVPVVTYGSDEFPAFFSPRSGVASPLRSDSVAELARIICASQQLRMQNGMVVAVPNPQPAEGEVIEAAVQQALRELAAQRVQGRDVTPFVLKRVNELTGGASLTSNIALVKHNAAIGAQIAIQLAALQKQLIANAEQEAAASEGPGGLAKSGALAAGLASAAALRASASDSSLNSLASAIAGLPHAEPPEPALSHHSMTRPRQADVDSHEHVSASSREGWPSANTPKRHYRSMHTAARSANDVLGRPVVFGGAVVDILCKPLPGERAFSARDDFIPNGTRIVVRDAGKPLIQATSNPGIVKQSYGGVGRNVCEAMSRVGSPPVLVTALGSDPHGDGLVKYLTQELGMVVLSPSAAPTAQQARTAVYSALLDGDGELVAAVADMEAFDSLTPARLAPSPLAAVASTLSQTNDAISVKVEDVIAAAPLVIIDGNIPKETTAMVCKSAASAHPRPVPVLFESTSIAKCTRLIDAKTLHHVSVVKPNRYEVMELARAWRFSMGLAPLVTETAGSKSHAPSDSGSRDEDPSEEMITETYDVNVTDAAAKPADTPSFTALAQQLGLSRSGNTNPVAPEALASDDTEDSSEVAADYLVLTAAQTVLAGMIRPGGQDSPISPESIAAAEGHLDALRHGSSSTQSPPPNATWTEGALVEGRKHVIVTLGGDGVLWLSAPPAPDAATADLLAVLPFFAAAQHPRIGMDFKLCPAPRANMVKCTGAGDTLTGVVAASLLQGHSFARALERGLAGAKIAVESETHVSTVSEALSAARVDEVASRDIRPIDPEYA